LETVFRAEVGKEPAEASETVIAVALAHANLAHAQTFEEEGTRVVGVRITELGEELRIVRPPGLGFLLAGDQRREALDFDIQVVLQREPDRLVEGEAQRLRIVGVRRGFIRKISQKIRNFIASAPPCRCFAQL